jgi:hypothetical protein
MGRSHTPILKLAADIFFLILDSGLHFHQFGLTFEDSFSLIGHSVEVSNPAGREVLCVLRLL